MGIRVIGQKKFEVTETELLQQDILIVEALGELEDYQD